MTEFRGKTAVITGAARGFGMEFAKECAARGMNLVLADICPAALGDAAKKFAGAGVGTVTVEADVSLYEEVEKVIAAATERFGTVDLLFNNAGVYFIGTLWDMPARDMRWMMEANVLSVMYGMKAALPIMMKQGTPCHVVNTASLAGMVSMRTMATYHASKHAVLAASEAALLDLQKAEANIGISVFCPGYVQTSLHHSEEYRPARFAAPSDPYYQSETYKKNIESVNRFITTGEGIASVAPTVFAAIEAGQFYVRTEATEKAIGFIKKRCANVIEKKNPDINNLA